MSSAVGKWPRLPYCFPLTKSAFPPCSWRMGGSAACGGIIAAIERARALAPDKKIIVEVETLAELEEAAELKPDQIMLDNFSVEMLKEAAGMAIESTLEVSGNLTLDNAGGLPKNRHWFLSSGALTKHVQATDLSLRLKD